MKDDWQTCLGVLVINFEGHEFFYMISWYEVAGKELKEIGFFDENNYRSLRRESQEEFAEIKLVMKNEKEDETIKLMEEQL